MEAAETLRDAALATTAARAGAKVERARRVNAAQRSAEQSVRDELLGELEVRLAQAEHRRQAYLAMVQKVGLSYLLVHEYVFNWVSRKEMCLKGVLRSSPPYA